MESCEWVEDGNEDFSIWNTTCGNAFTFESGNVLDNGFAYCPYCGRALTMRAADVCQTCGGLGRAYPTLSDPDGVECPDCTRR